MQRVATTARAGHGIVWRIRRKPAVPAFPELLVGPCQIRHCVGTVHHETQDSDVHQLRQLGEFRGLVSGYDGPNPAADPAPSRMPRSAVSEPRGSEPVSVGGTIPSGKAPIRSEPTVRCCTAVPRLRSGSTSSTSQTQRPALSPGIRDSRAISRTSKPICSGKPTPCIRSCTSGRWRSPHWRRSRPSLRRVSVSVWPVPRLPGPRDRRSGGIGGPTSDGRP